MALGMSGRRFKKLLVFLSILLLFIIGLHYVGVNDIATEYLLNADGEFLQQINVLVENVKNANPLLGFLLDLDSEIDMRIRLPNYLVTKEAKNPHIQTFDPRFTYGMVISDIARQIELGKLVSLPVFHWADWTDLSMLDEHLLAVDKEAADAHEDACKSYFTTRKTPKDNEVLTPKDFCINTGDFDSILSDQTTDQSMKDYIGKIMTSPYKTKFHVFKNGGRSSSKNKILEAKSYLNDFMPPPYNLVLLVQDEGTSAGPIGVKVPVNQDISSREKIMDSSLVEDYLIGKQEQRTGDVYLNVKDELKVFNNQIKKSSSNIISRPLPYNYSIHLSEDMFEDPSESILKSMNQKEFTKPEDISYLNTLKYTTIPELEAGKYFSEAKLIRTEKDWANGAHYDWRFFNGLVKTADKQQIILFNLLKAWLSFTNTYQINTWIAHGSLLSWYWNGLSFPWDIDIDVQMPIADLHKLSHEFNQSIIVDLASGQKNGGVRTGRYFIDCGTYISQRERRNGFNNIDARFIDLDTGTYIDITALSTSDTWCPLRYDNDVTNPPIEQPPSPTILTGNNIIRNRKAKLYNCKNNHFALFQEVSPLRFTMIEGLPTYIVHDYEEVLRAEYNDKGLYKKGYSTKMFLHKLKLFVDFKPFNNWIRKNLQLPTPDIKVDLKGREERDHDPYRTWKDENWLQLMGENDDILMEWYLTHELSGLHNAELKILEKDKASEASRHLFLNEDGTLKSNKKEIRHDFWSFNEIKDNLSFDLKVGKTANLIENQGSTK